MGELNYYAAFLIGLLGSTHCVGMCGGIVGALTMGLPVESRRSSLTLFPFLITYNSGRLISYSIAGLIIGYMTVSAGKFFQTGSFPVGGLIGGLFMIALGVTIAGWWQALTPLERIGGHAWRLIEPLGRRLMPVKTLPHAFGLGLLWGWLPCGMVYSTLAWSATSGDPLKSAMLMLSFGAGTLPMLLAMGSLADRLQKFTRNKNVRVVAGVILIVFGTLILTKAFSGGGHH